jgi:hypothetical protein
MNFFHVSLFSFQPASIYTGPLSQAACGMRVTCDFGLGEGEEEEEGKGMAGGEGGLCVESEPPPWSSMDSVMPRRRSMGKSPGVLFL